MSPIEVWAQGEAGMPGQDAAAGRIASVIALASPTRGSCRGPRCAAPREAEDSMLSRTCELVMMLSSTMVWLVRLPKMMPSPLPSITLPAMWVPWASG